MSARFKTKINGRKHAGAEEMPLNDGAADVRAVGDTPALHSGARLAAKLNAKIILNDTEFSNPGEMTVDDRRLYHEALAAVFPASIAVSVSEAGKIKQSVADRGRPRWSFLSLISQLLRLKR